MDSKMCRLLALCLAMGLPFALACSAQKAAKLAPVVEWPNPSWGRYHYTMANDVASAAGLGRLHEAELNGKHKEVRIWIGGGHGWPQTLYRFSIHKSAVHGEYYLYWPADSSKRAGLEEDRIAERLRPDCENMAYGLRYAVCRKVFPEEPDWESIYAELSDLDLWILRDESELRPKVDFMVLDGWGITVELRDGGKYRAYEHNNPRTKPWPEARRAARMAELLWERI